MALYVLKLLHELLKYLTKSLSFSSAYIFTVYSNVFSVSSWKTFPLPKLAYDLHDSYVLLYCYVIPKA